MSTETTTEPTTAELVTLARGRYEAWHRAEMDLRDSLKPELLIEHVPATFTDDPFIRVTCPGCGATELHDAASGETWDTALRDVDASERWTEPQRIDTDGKALTFCYDGSTDYDGVTLLMTCCYTPVDLPESWTTEAGW